MLASRLWLSHCCWLWAICHESEMSKSCAIHMGALPLHCVPLSSRQSNQKLFLCLSRQSGATISPLQFPYFVHGHQAGRNSDGRPILIVRRHMLAQLMEHSCFSRSTPPASRLARHARVAFWRVASLLKPLSIPTHWALGLRCLRTVVRLMQVGRLHFAVRPT